MTAQQHGPYLEAERVGAVTVIRFTGPGDFTGEKVNVAGGYLDRLLAQTEPWLFVLDCGAVRHHDSALLARIIDLNYKAPMTGGRVVLCRLVAELSEMLGQLGIAGRFHVCAGEREALQSFQEQAPKPKKPRSRPQKGK